MPGGTLVVLDGLGAVAIALAAATCGGLAHAWESPLATCTILGCAAILAPFLAVASITTSLGVVCCAPVAFGGVACAYLPSVLRHLFFLTVGMAVRLFESEPALLLRKAAAANPAAAVLVVGGLLAISPLLLLLGAIGAFWYLVFLPVTAPLTLYVCYNHLPAGPSVFFQELRAKRHPYDESVYSGYYDGYSTVGSSSRTGPSGRAGRQQSAAGRAERMRTRDTEGDASDALTSPPPSEFYAESQATGVGADGDDSVGTHTPRPSRELP